MSTGAGNSVLWKLISAIFSCFERLKLRLENTDANEISSNDRRDVTQTTRLAILALAGENEFKVVIKRLLHACDFTDEVTNLLRSHSRPHRTHNALGDNIASAIGPYKEEFVGSLKIIVAKFKRLFRLLKEDISEILQPISVGVELPSELTIPHSFRKLNRTEQIITSIRKQVTIVTGILARRSVLPQPNHGYNWDHQKDTWKDSQKFATILHESLYSLRCRCGREHVPRLFLRYDQDEKPDTLYKRKRANVLFNSESGLKQAVFNIKTPLIDFQIEGITRGHNEPGHRDMCQNIEKLRGDQALKFQISPRSGNARDIRGDLSPEKVKSIPSVESLDDIDITHIPEEDRNDLSLVLTAGVLQFAHTDWLGYFWTFRNIIFPTQSSQGSEARTIFVKPLVDPTFEHSHLLFNNTSARGRHQAAMLGLAYAIAQILSEGTLDLKLSGRTIEDVWSAGPRGPAEACTLLDTALTAHQNAGQQLPAIVRRCIECFQAPEFDLRESNDCDYVLNGVLKPLKYSI